MNLADYLEWLEAIEAEFGNLKITQVCVLPICQNRTEVTLKAVNAGASQTHLKTFDNRWLEPVAVNGEVHP